MNSVGRVRALCKSKNIPISRLEKDLGYANAYISQLRKGVLPDDRLVEIAKYLEVTTDFLLGSENKEKPTTISGDELSSDLDIKFKKIWANLNDDQKKMLLAQMEFYMQNQ